MAKIRIRDLAKELDVKNSYLIELLEERFGLYNLKPASSIETEIAEKLKDHVMKEKDKGSEAEVIKAEDGTVIRKHRTFVLRKRRPVKKKVEEKPAEESAEKEEDAKADVKESKEKREVKEKEEEKKIEEKKVTPLKVVPPAPEEEAVAEDVTDRTSAAGATAEGEAEKKLEISEKELEGAVRVEGEKTDEAKEPSVVVQESKPGKVIELEERKLKKKPRPEKKTHKGVLKKKALEEFIEEETIDEPVEATEDKSGVVERVFEPGRQPRRKKAVEKGKKEPSTLPPKPKKRVIRVEEVISVTDLSRTMGVKLAEIIKKFMDLGLKVQANQTVDADTAALVAEEFGYKVENIAPEYESLLEDAEEKEENLESRAPVVTIMGHVDHGKTTLLDAIRKTKVAESEAGGITQSIGAYEVEIDGKKITFIDTPGHEAFTEMRARGGQVADIVVLVVAADDGVMPQTLEAIDHAKAAGVPIVVAVNKVDKPNANPDRVKNELAEQGLIPEDWGGDTLFAHVSALKKEGISELLELILLQAEVMDLKANPNKRARGVIIETSTQKGKGNVANAIVRDGTLRVGDAVVSGACYGKVRALFDHLGKKIKEAGPSKPVEILGFNTIPAAGETFVVLESEKLAREIAMRRLEKEREKEKVKTPKLSLEELYSRIQEGEIKELPVIVKADVQGSVDALRDSLERIGTEEVKVNVIHAGVGGITESDVNLASASDAIIIGFRVRPDGNARKLAERERVEIKVYEVIYDLLDDVKKAMAGLLEPEYKEIVQGRAEVRETFNIPKVGTVAGCYVLEGKISRNSNARVLRDNVIVYTGKIASLRRFKEDVKEVAQGYECGIGLENFNDVKPGDVIEAFVLEEITPEL